MNTKKIILALALVSFFFANSQEKKENSFSSKWDNGFKFENSDKSIKMKFGGRIMYDFGFYSL